MAWPLLLSFATLREIHLPALPGNALFTLFIVICAFYIAFLALMNAISAVYFVLSPVFLEVKIRP